MLIQHIGLKHVSSILFYPLLVTILMYYYIRSPNLRSFLIKASFVFLTAFEVSGKIYVAFEGWIPYEKVYSEATNNCCVTWSRDMSMRFIAISFKKRSFDTTCLKVLQSLGCEQFEELHFPSMSVEAFP